MENIQLVSSIRQQIRVVEKQPGTYRWWFPEKEANKLLAHFKSPMTIDDRKLQEWTDKNGEKYVALYCGIGKDMRQRVHWHIFGPFKSSTLRRTLGSIIVTTTDNAESLAKKVNELIDKCYWEWEYVPYEVANEWEESELSEIQYVYPFNIKENTIVSKEWIKELKCFRKKVKSITEPTKRK